jgi:hypothetical protein
MPDQFDPRRAEPGQEFGYTGSVEKTIDEDEELPAGATLLSVDEESGERRIRLDGVQKTLKADADGVVHPKSNEDVALADAFGLPVAQKAKAAEKEKADEPRKSEASEKPKE